MNKQVFLREKEVTTMLGISRATLHRGIKTGRYPQPIKISVNRNGWYLPDVEACISELRGNNNAER